MDELIENWLREEAEPFNGWDFSQLRGRWVEDDPPWSYEEMARAALAGANCAVDLGTGGGERLAELADAFPRRMFATEAYLPNLSVARDRLAPDGVVVVAYGSDDVVGGPLPFQSGSIETVLARHEGYGASEVARVLAQGGVFLTQQVHGRSLEDLRREFGVVGSLEVTLERSVAELRAAGLSIEVAEEWWGASVFRDVGAIVRFLNVAPWEVPGFSVRRHDAVLRALQRRLEREGELRYRIGRFVVRARKPRGRVA
ncbi:MAG: hypothetical protein ACRDGE_11020 [Candidatus Limnocylindria bacterium]